MIDWWIDWLTDWLILGKSCSRHNDIAQGIIDQPDDPVFEDEATFSCVIGYELCPTCVDKKKCEASGQWTDERVECVSA